jgi:hypothetical protein
VVANIIDHGRPHGHWILPDPAAQKPVVPVSREDLALHGVPIPHVWQGKKSGFVAERLRENAERIKERSSRSVNFVVGMHLSTLPGLATLPVPQLSATAPRSLVCNLSLLRASWRTCTLARGFWGLRLKITSMSYVSGCGGRTSHPRPQRAALCGSFRWTVLLHWCGR